MIALIDYGIGNLRSVQKALEYVGAEARLTVDPAVMRAADKVVLPGVGAFGDGMKGLRARGLVDAVREIAARGTPLLGICVGMQVLFDSSEEMGQHPGLGILPGRVKRFAPEDTLATTDYGGAYPSVVGRGRVYGIQFHPEKSQSVGLLLLRNFVERG
ncbi:MAG: imidazole glycerol phosphate synthase subunit HisH [Chloroflexi bacterium]|nr:imidazole glycerol phosphate synthase subunit HisH [Chloroflexota bacterium]